MMEPCREKPIPPTDLPERAPIHPAEIIALSVAVFGAILLHGAFRVQGFGEPDAARLAVQAVSWVTNGQPITSYTLRVSPLYLFGLKYLIDAGVAIASLPAVMNMVNVIVSGLVLVPLYFLFRRLASRQIAAIACLLFCFTPAFWASGIYGMPHLPSFAFFVTAVLLYAIGIEKCGRAHWSFASAASLCMIIAILLKADLILCSAALLGTTIVLRRVTRSHIAEAIAIPAISLAAAIGLSALLFPSLEAMTREPGAWSDQFPFTLKALTDSQNRLVMLRTGGPLFLSVALLSCLAMATRTRYRFLIFALSWSVPPIAWWGLRLWNSGRHMMASFAALAFIAAMGIVLMTPRRWGRLAPWTVCTIVVVANYFSGSTERSLWAPPTRLHLASAEIQSEADYHHEIGRAFAAAGNRSLGLATGARPYLQWEVFASGRPFRFAPHRSVMDPWETYLENANGETDTLRLVYVFEPFEIDLGERWQIWTRDPELRHFAYKRIPSTDTKLRFDIAQTSDVVIGVYDLNDRLIKTLMDKRLEAGTYHVVWDGRDGLGRLQPVGIYLFRMRLGEGLETRRIMLQFSKEPFIPPPRVRPRTR